MKWVTDLFQIQRYSLSLCLALEARSCWKWLDTTRMCCIFLIFLLALFQNMFLLFILDQCLKLLCGWERSQRRKDANLIAYHWRIRIVRKRDGFKTCIVAISQRISSWKCLHFHCKNLESMYPFSSLISHLSSFISHHSSLIVHLSSLITHLSLRKY